VGAFAKDAPDAVMTMLVFANSNISNTTVSTPFAECAAIAP